VLDDVGNLATTIIGTPYYISPEIFSNTPYDQKTDIWSLGCCMYEIVSLHQAFEATDMNSLVIKILRERKLLPLPLATEIVPVEGSKQTNYRYFDIGDLPDQTLLPITGYNKKSLTSLENAVRDVEHLLDDIQVKIIIAKKNVQKCHGILSIDESAAIQLYTMETLPLDRCLYYNLNKTLRTANRRELEPWFTYLKLLLTALYKLPSVRRTVWRGIKNVDLSGEYQEGQCYTWWNLSSCTDTLTVMQTTQFLGTSGLRTLFAIECENGKEIKDYSYVRNEKEILLPPATHIEVLGKINPAPDLHIIHVREIAPPYVLISPPL
ncbi:unnamed protein product, partial [Rotaria sp. Silwood1]